MLYTRARGCRDGTVSLKVESGKGVSPRTYKTLPTVPDPAPTEPILGGFIHPGPKAQCSLRMPGPAWADLAAV